jgi:hypothetical protein
MWTSKDFQTIVLLAQWWVFSNLSGFNLLQNSERNSNENQRIYQANVNEQRFPVHIFFLWFHLFEMSAQ